MRLGQKLLSCWVWLVVRSRDLATPPTMPIPTEEDYERDHQTALPQGRKAADGCKPRHARDDSKREHSFSGLRRTANRLNKPAPGISDLMKGYSKLVVSKDTICRLEHYGATPHMHVLGKKRKYMGAALKPS